MIHKDSWKIPLVWIKSPGPVWDGVKLPPRCAWYELCSLRFFFCIPPKGSAPFLFYRPRGPQQKSREKSAEKTFIVCTRVMQQKIRLRGCPPAAGSEASESSRPHRWGKYIYLSTPASSQGTPLPGAQDPSALAPAPGASDDVSWCRLQCQDLAFGTLHPAGDNTSQPELYPGVI